MSPARQPEWWFCQEPDCDSPDRAYGLQARFWAQLWLEQLKADPRGMSVLQDLVEKNIKLPPFRVADGTLVRQIEELLLSGRLHLHQKQREVHSGSGVEQKFVAFPLADHQPRDASPPPPLRDPPSFSPNTNLSAQAAVLAAAAANGTPFCQE